MTTHCRDIFADALAQLIEIDSSWRSRITGESGDSAWTVAQQATDDLTAVSRAFAKTLGVEWFEDLRAFVPSAQFIERIPIHFARRQQIIGLLDEQGKLILVLSTPEHWHQIDVLERYLNCQAVPALASGEQVMAAIDRCYQQRDGQADAAIQKLDIDEAISESEGIAKPEDLLDITSKAPVIQIVNLLLFEAVKQEASDVHIQPHENHLAVRLRIDGVLFDAFELPKSIQEEILSRFKIMGKMNIAEKRLAQDGRATVQVGDRLVDLRIASLPTSHGERLVIRLLDKGARLYTLGELGMPTEVLKKFRELINVEHGLILVTGPTGSGKSTTLYAALQELNAKELNILTLEDPIEYQLPGVSQTQVNLRKGMTFASGLRHVLRQDPDIIMVGEIRDHETAVMAIQSALTGHLVFSTLHTNDAASAVTRLLDLGIEPYLVASSVIGVMAQRLVRRVCPHCSHPAASENAESQKNAKHGTISQTPSGCDTCRHTGYRGRIGIFELLVTDIAIQRQVQERATAADIHQTAAHTGMHTLREDGLAKVQSGITTMDEILRVTMRANH